RELAITAAAAITFVGDRAGKAYSRIESAERSVRHAAVLLFQIGLEIVAETVVYRQAARDFPAVLYIRPEGVTAEPGFGFRALLQRVRKAQEKAGVTETAAVGVVQRLPVLPWVGSLRSGELKAAVRSP